MISRLINRLFYPYNKLIFYYNKKCYGDYGMSFFVSKRTSICEFIKNINNKQLNIGCIYNHMMFPVIDADDERNMILSSMWLRENKTDHAIISSSPNKYWVIVDNLGHNWKSIKHWVNYTPGQDVNYISFCNSRKMCFLRAEMKEEYFVPILIEKCESPIINQFCEKLIKYFESDVVRWMYRYNLYKSGEIDLSNPDIDLNFTLNNVDDLME